jgi:hypothetical protein
MVGSRGESFLAGRVAQYRQALNALPSRNGIRVETPILLPLPYLYPHAADPHRGHGGIHSGQTGFL